MALGSSARLFALLSLVVLILPIGQLVAQEGQDLESVAGGIVSRMDKADDARLWLLSGELSSLGRKAVPVLEKLLAASSPRAQLGIASAMIDLEERTQGTKALLALAAAGNPLDVRLPAIEVIGSKGSDDIEAELFTLLDDCFDARVRISLSRTIWELTRDPRAKQVLKSTLQSTDPEVRIAGALALAEIGDTEAVKSILEKLADQPTEQGRLARALLTQARWRERAFSSWRTPAKEDTPAEKEPRAVVQYDDALLKTIKDHIDEYYLDAPELKDVDLLEAAAKGIMAALDPHSVYFTPKERFDWFEDLNPVYGGIGSYVNLVDDIFTIVRPMFGGPAYRAGLKPGDAILAIDGWMTTGHTTNEIVKVLRGHPGTKVIISVYRKGWQKPRDFELTREQITVPTVNGTMLPGDVAYITLSTFGRDSAEELDAELRKLEEDGMKSLILDLRFNTGGYLETAKRVCDLFLDRGKTVVWWEGRNKRVAPRRDLLTTSGTTHQDFPLVILINGQSASASEIVAGCLQHYGRAVLVGLRTFGKGSVQNLYPIFTVPPAEPWKDVNANGTYDFAERFEDLNNNGVWDPNERFADLNRNRKWDDGEPYTDTNGNGHFDYPAVKITIAKYYLPSGVSLLREKITEDGKIRWIGGVEPNIWIGPEEPDGWRNEEIAKLEEKNAFDAYLDEQWEKNPELLRKLAYDDGGTPDDYPEFDQLYENLDTRLDRESTWWWLRFKTRRKVGDMSGREIIGDFVTDQMLQRAIIEILGKAALDPAGVPEYKLFAGKLFPEVDPAVRKGHAADPADGR